GPTSSVAPPAAECADSPGRDTRRNGSGRLVRPKARPLARERPPRDPTQPRRKPATGRKISFPVCPSRQCEDVQRIVAARRLQLRLCDESPCQQSFSRPHRDVLLPVHGVRDRAVLNRPAERRPPKPLSASRVEASDPPI